MTEDRVRDVLRRAVPDPPMIEWEPRRPLPRIPVPLVAAALVLLVLLPLGYLLRQESSTLPVGPTLTPGEFECPPPGVAPAGPDGGTLPPGAVAARLCLPSPTPSPPDALTAGLAELVGWVNQQPLADPDTPCELDARPLVRVVFQYSDGRRLSVSAEQGGCRTIEMGDVRRTGGPELLQRYVELLRARRSVTPVQVPADVTVPPCSWADDGPVTSPVPWHPEIIRARACPGGTLLAPDEVDSVVFGLRRHPGPAPACEGDEPAAQLLIGTTARGEVVTLASHCDGVLLSSGGGAWVPDEQGRRVLEQHLRP